MTVYDLKWAQHVFDSYDEICSALALLTKHIPDPSDTFHGKKHHLSLFSLSVSYAAVWASGRMIGSRSYQMTRATGPRASYVAFTDTERLIGDAAKNQVQ